MAKSSKPKVTSAESAAKRATKKAIAAQKPKKASGKAKPFKVHESASSHAAKGGVSAESFSKRVSTPDRFGNTANTPESQMHIAEQMTSNVHKSRMPGRGEKNTRTMGQWSESNVNRERQAARSYRGVSKLERETDWQPATDVRKWQSERPKRGSARADYVSWGIRKPGFKQESLNRSQGKPAHGDKSQSEGQQFKGKAKEE